MDTIASTLNTIALRIANPYNKHRQITNPAQRETPIMSGEHPLRLIERFLQGDYVFSPQSIPLHHL